jgi:Ser/Thr protein kinase RdoA (MazF antagonist)
VVGRQETADHRPQLRPGLLGEYAAELTAAGVVHPDFVMDFQEACASAGKILDPLLAVAPRFRIHGDFHRGNILVRGDQSLLLIDFDDAAMGPAIQDLWLLLPGRYGECRREMNLILEGYEEFSDFDRNELDLVEPLRFFRMVHFLRWQALQRSDAAFYRTFPDWGTRAFWTKEVEDLRDQLEFLY